jgi:hypothetical protein
MISSYPFLYLENVLTIEEVDCGELHYLDSAFLQKLHRYIFLFTQKITLIFKSNPWTWSEELVKVKFKLF